MLSVYIAMLIQQSLGHSCVCQVGPLGLHSLPGQGRGPLWRMQGIPGTSDLETQILDSELSVGEAASANDSSLSLGLTQPSFATC